MSELLQKLIIGLFTVTVLIGLSVLVGNTAQAYKLRVNEHTLLLIDSSLVPSCDWLYANHIEFIESQDTYEITTDELCE